ncbi:hypothetical protein KFK09_010541 [Dendrobium nobile]|uniref:MIP18 family-like domain-containing protein n=1 Tax=Dendrobium nobile TaxID=94219 RepID=A0A8T3BCX4_DENNO|nr:hypothetical protein KFK09_010541 [Dendrobium nobile]
MEIPPAKQVRYVVYKLKYGAGALMATIDTIPMEVREMKLEELDWLIVLVDAVNAQPKVTFTPTVEHCSMATIIGLCIRVKLMRSLPSRYKIDIRLAPGSHATEAAVNKQLNDKERVAAALENPNLAEVVAECLAPTFA